MSTKKSCVIFDFDGTLLNSIGNAYRGACAVFEREGLTPPSFMEYYRDLKPPFVDFYRSRGVKASDREIHEHFRAAARPEEAQFFDDVESVLWQLRHLGVPMAIVSHNQQEVLHFYCHNRFDDFFAAIWGGIEQKASVLQQIVSQTDADPKRTFYVGDFPSDMRAAISAGIVPVGITRGHQTRGMLIDAGAQVCVDDLEQLVLIVRNQLK